jgi:polar amino acid transport system substrate-binding protein
MNELIPTGKLRSGIVFAPELSALFVVKDANGEPRGITVDLSRELAKKLGVALEFAMAPNSGIITDALAAGEIDVAFMPIDEERKRRVDFGPAYFIVQSTYLVTAASGLHTLADVDQPHVRVVGIANTTTIRASARTLKTTQPIAAAGVGDAVEMLRTGKADVFALSRESLPPFVPQIPGSKIVDGGFQQTGVAIAVPKGRPAALAYVTQFMNEAKASGVVRRALDAAGFKNDPVAP